MVATQQMGWLPIMATVGLAAVLWGVTFYLSYGVFWFKIATSALLLAAISMRLSPAEIRRTRFGLKAVAIGLLSAVALYAIFWLGKIITSQIFAFAQPQIGSIYDKGHGTSMGLIACLLFFITGPSEEIYWRGFLQKHLMQRLGGWQGWVVATCLYAGVHIWSLNFMLIGAAGVAGAFWGALYWRVGNLGPVIISHSIWSTAIFTLFPMH
jgi:membrane protease YdiL (CAAX protease family)